MVRLARVVVPGYPHHITQRGNRRQQTFFCDKDYQAYIDFMAEWCARLGVSIWFYCLMPNHVHLIAVPESQDGLRRAVGEAHQLIFAAETTRWLMFGEIGMVSPDIQAAPNTLWLIFLKKLDFH